MVLTVSRCGDHIRHALGTDLPAELSVLEVLQHAGTHLTNARSWRWLERDGTVSAAAGATSIDLTAALPDLQTVLPRGAQYNDANGYDFNEVGLSILNDFRTSSPFSIGRPTHYSIVPSMTAEGVYSLILQAWPGFSTAITDGISIYYRAGFQIPLDGKDTSIVAVPSWMEPLFVQYLRATAQGYHESDQGPMSARLDGIVASSMFQGAALRDAALQLSYGPQRYGGVAMQMNRGITAYHRTPASVPDP